MKTLDLAETIRMSLASLRANKLRAALTLLGIVIGVFSFIGVMTGIEVLQSTIESSFNVLGTNTLNVTKYPAVSHGPGDREKYRNRKDLTIEHGEYLRENLKHAQYVNIQVNSWGGVVAYGNKKTNPNVGIVGGTSDIAQVSSRDIESGRIFNEAELEQGRSFAVLGMGVAKMLFTREDPLGKTVRVDGRPYTVIGVIAEKGGLFGANEDNFVFIPYTTFAQQYGKARRVSFQIKAADQADFETMTDEVIGMLRALRRVPPGEENDFEIMTNESLIGEVNKLTYYIRMGTGAVSAIALLAAGIGIMNIMLVSVTERTREIGIRKALGATRRSILQQFLTEAVVICEVGGVIGIVLGLGGGNIVAALLDIPPVLPIGWALIGVAVTSMIGVAFGVYPAWKASNLDPIEALRYE